MCSHRDGLEKRLLRSMNLALVALAAIAKVVGGLYCAAGSHFGLAMYMYAGFFANAGFFLDLANSDGAPAIFENVCAFYLPTPSWVHRHPWFKKIIDENKRKVKLSCMPAISKYTVQYLSQLPRVLSAMANTVHYSPVSTAARTIGWQQLLQGMDQSRWHVSAAVHSLRLLLIES